MTKSSRRRRRRRGRGPHSKADNDYRAGRYVSISMRRYNLTTGLMQHCKGCNIRAYDFEPEELRDLFVRAMKAAAEEYQAIRRGDV